MKTTALPPQTRIGCTPRGKRIPAAERERMILAEAIRFFADEGFDGQLRALAGRIGMTHSVLFRHFPSKDMLIARVYREVFLSRWRPQWTVLLRDRSIGLEARLLHFYREYTAVIFQYEWVRIFMFAGLRGVPINAPYLALLRENVLLPICAELRAACGLPDPAACPLSDEEVELAWGLHGRIFYLAIRKFVYGMAIPSDMDRSLRDAIAVFLVGAAAISQPPGGSAGGAPPPERVADAVMPVSWERPAPAAGTAGPHRRRMRPELRERFIVDEAIRFFAEHGTDGQLRELARRLGVTHPLLYRYFPTKEALIERVYQELYLGRWKPEWDTMLRDGSRPFRARLTEFYVDYVATINSYEWTRIFIFAGLRGVGICQPYLAMVQQRVIEPIAAELRTLAPRQPAEGRPLTEHELELAWGLHGQIFYLAIRRWVYDMPVPCQLDRVIEAAIADLLDGAVKAMRLVTPGPAGATG